MYYMVTNSCDWYSNDDNINANDNANYCCINGSGII